MVFSVVSWVLLCGCYGILDIGLSDAVWLLWNSGLPEWCCVVAMVFWVALGYFGLLLCACLVVLGSCLAVSYWSKINPPSNLHNVLVFRWLRFPASWFLFCHPLCNDKVNSLVKVPIFLYFMLLCIFQMFYPNLSSKCVLWEWNLTTSTDVQM